MPSHKTKCGIEVNRHRWKRLGTTEIREGTPSPTRAAASGPADVSRHRTQPRARCHRLCRGGTAAGAADDPQQAFPAAGANDLEKLLSPGSPKQRPALQGKQNCFCGAPWCFPVPPSSLTLPVSETPTFPCRTPPSPVPETNPVPPPARPRGEATLAATSPR